MFLVKNHGSEKFRAEYLNDDDRVLNAGSGLSRKRRNDVNVDIVAKPGVDVVADIHSLPPIGLFDAVICVAALQYCHTPPLVAEQFYHVLNDGGHLYVDAPWVQPFCPDTPDLWRFSEDGLKGLFVSAGFEVVESGPSIRPGSAFAMLGADIAGSLTGNRYIDFGLRHAAGLTLTPFKWIRTAEESKTAGAHYLVARKS